MYNQAHLDELREKLDDLHEALNERGITHWVEGELNELSRLLYENSQALQGSVQHTQDFECLRDWCLAALLTEDPTLPADHGLDPYDVYLFKERARAALERQGYPVTAPRYRVVRTTTTDGNTVRVTGVRLEPLPEGA